jgi:[ribosomal protein S5]-alanine N-acetyltransferase
VQTLETNRLTLIPFSLDLKKATITEKATLGEMLGVGVPDSWPGHDLAEALPVFVKNMEKDSSGPVWDWLIIHKTDKVLIGDIGFMGGPNEEGAVEIGYSIVPEYRNQAYATEAVNSLIHWAFQKQEIKAITAKTLKDNSASIKVLIKAGMNCLGLEDNWLIWETAR